MKANRQQIIQDLNVVQQFSAPAEIQRRVDFLKNYMTRSDRFTLVLGVSGGVDSLAAGLLCQKAVNELRAAGVEASLVAMRLPYGVQKDEADAQACLACIQPNVTLTVNIKPATDSMLSTLTASAPCASQDDEDFIKGNIKARQRMIAQYAEAGRRMGLVIGTENVSEEASGFFTSHGDSAADLVVLSGLVKRHVREIATALGAPESLVNKVPTADLEDLAPQKADEDALGFTYAEIDAYLLGEYVSESVASLIIARYEATRHKRRRPYSVFDA